MQVPDIVSAGAIPGRTAAILDTLRVQAPRVHCITNTVAQNFTANVLLAAGAVPAMTVSLEEVGSFVARSNALLVNLGTLDRERREAIDIAVEIAADEKVPWVIDPVFIDRVPFRAELARALVERGARAIRLNASEFRAIADREPSPDGIAQYAREREVTVALTGETDVVADAARRATVANGHPLMAKVTAMGCAVSAMVAACLAVERDPWVATAAALLAMGVAGERAAAGAKGPGSFAAGVIDALHGLDAETIAQYARVT